MVAGGLCLPCKSSVQAQVSLLLHSDLPVFHCQENSTEVSIGLALPHPVFLPAQHPSFQVANADCTIRNSVRVLSKSSLSQKGAGLCACAFSPSPALVLCD
jgi:hypothetical protein